MANRNVILLHLLESDTYEFYGSPASLFDKHEANELLIAQILARWLLREKSLFTEMPIAKSAKAKFTLSLQHEVAKRIINNKV